MENDTALTCLMRLLYIVCLAPLTAFTAWSISFTWGWPWFGVGWWTDHGVPGWELRWVVAIIFWTVALHAD
jgi:hypothetical protein